MKKLRYQKIVPKNLNTKLIGRIQKSVQILFKKASLDFWYTFGELE